MLDIWFNEDIRNALLAADEASTSTARVCAAIGGDQVTLRAYLEGYRAALTTVALAFGLRPQILEEQYETEIERIGLDGDSDRLSDRCFVYSLETG